MTTVRRSAAVFAASAVLCLAFAPSAVAGGDVPVRPRAHHARTPAPPQVPAPAPPSRPVTPSPSLLPAAPSLLPTPLPPPSAPVVIPAGLYGTKDPAHDGVWRQSLAILGQYAAGLRPANEAVAWLKGQQCADGAFPVYRAAPALPCDATAKPEVRATAVAMQALSTVYGQRPVIGRATEWLRTVQNEDGGWSRRPGGASDTYSTSLVIGALASAGVRPSSMRTPQGNGPYDALVSFSIPCSAGGGDGGFAYQPDSAGKLVADPGATAAGLLGGIGKRMAVGPVKPGPAPSCRTETVRTPERAARNGAAYLAAVLARTGHLAAPAPPGAAGGTPPPDPGRTADAVAALAVAGYRNQAAGALEWLKKNSAAWARENGPAAYARLIIAAHTTSTDPRNFGGIDLVERLNASGPAPKPWASATPSASDVSGSGDGGGSGVMWVVVLGLVTTGGIGLLLGARRRARQP